MLYETFSIAPGIITSDSNEKLVLSPLSTNIYYSSPDTNDLRIYRAGSYYNYPVTEMTVPFADMSSYQVPQSIVALNFYMKFYSSQYGYMVLLWSGN